MCRCCKIECCSSWAWFVFFLPLKFALQCRKLRPFFFCSEGLSVMACEWRTQIKQEAEEDDIWKRRKKTVKTPPQMLTSKPSIRPSVDHPSTQAGPLVTQSPTPWRGLVSPSHTNKQTKQDRKCNRKIFLSSEPDDGASYFPNRAILLFAALLSRAGECGRVPISATDTSWKRRERGDIRVGLPQTVYGKAVQKRWGFWKEVTLELAPRQTQSLWTAPTKVVFFRHEENQRRRQELPRRYGRSTSSRFWQKGCFLLLLGLLKYSTMANWWWWWL